MPPSCRTVCITVIVWGGAYTLIVGVAVCCWILTLCLPIWLAISCLVGFPPDKRFLSTRSNALIEFESAAMDAFLAEHPSISCEVLSRPLSLDLTDFNFPSPLPMTHHTLLFYSGGVVPPQKKLILVHGVFSHPMGWKYVIPELCSLGFAVYCPALPGFGIVPLSGLDVRRRDPADWLTYYGQFVKALIRCLCPHGEKPTLVGHSFGGLVCSHFCCTYPDLFHELILVNPMMSLLPTLHERTPFWAIFYNYFPFYLLRAFGPVLNCYVMPLVRTDPFMLSEVALLTCWDNTGNQIVSQFIRVETIKSCWERPYLLNKLMYMAHRIHAICSMEDTISPVHSLKLLFELAGKKDPSLYITSGSTHNPSRDCPREFGCAMTHILNRPEPAEKAVPCVREMSDQVLDDIVRIHGWSVFDVNITRRNIQNLYSSLRTAVGCTGIDGAAYYIVDAESVVESYAPSPHFIPHM